MSLIDLTDLPLETPTLLPFDSSEVVDLCSETSTLVDVPITPPNTQDVVTPIARERPTSPIPKILMKRQRTLVVDSDSDDEHARLSYIKEDSVSEKETSDSEISEGQDLVVDDSSSSEDEDAEVRDRDDYLSDMSVDEFWGELGSEKEYKSMVKRRAAYLRRYPKEY